MKKIAYIVLLLIIVLVLTGCGKDKIGKENYQYIYDVVYDYNKTMTPAGKKENLFGYGEYLYNSYLVLIPRFTPSTLDEFCYTWVEKMDVDGFGIYFTCRLCEESFEKYKEGLENFTIKKGDSTKKVIINNADFKYPTYILQWLEPKNKWEVLEYIMLDKENNTVIYVYTMSELNWLEANSRYEIKPYCDLKDVIKSEQTDNSDMNQNMYSIYLAYEDGRYIYKDFENMIYDNSFLDCLNNE